jgi:sulfane dehydrogenase subunit SoxC
MRTASRGRPRASSRPSSGRWAWQRWMFDWDAEPGEYTLACRARDAAGDVQPLEPEWNVGGYANAVQRVPVTVV